MTTEQLDEMKAGREAACKSAAEFLTTLSDEELEAIWEVATTQIALAAAEKAKRMGVKNAKIAIIAMGDDEAKLVPMPEELQN